MMTSVGKLMSSTHTPVEHEAEFELNGRRGKVVKMGLTSSLVLWQEHVDKETGEVFPAIAATITHEQFRHHDLHGRLRIIRRPSASAAEGKRDRSHRTRAEIRRMRWRYSFVSAAQRLVADGDLEENRASFVARRDLILGLGMVYYSKYLAKEAGTEGKRGGAQVDLGTQSEPPKSAAHLFKWYCAYRKGGQEALFDEYIRSGNKQPRYTTAERELINSTITKKLDEERCSISDIVSNVRATFEVLNEDAARSNPPGEPVSIPGYGYIHSTIDALAPLDHAIRTRGLKVAYRDMHALGVGVKTSRALERVEVDEYTFDLMVILNGLRIWDWLRPEERAMLGLDGSTRRVQLSAAIDVHTRCIVGMQISASETTSLLRETVEMIFMDKTPIADAVGAHEPWDMHGRPEMIVLDRGPNYISDEVYDLLAALGITNMGAPAKKPWLRPFIERLFRTVHTGFAQRFSGRTFSNVVKRGENDAAARASMTIDDFLNWLVRWIVDIYHNTPHAGLLRRTPAEAWAQARSASPLQSVSLDEVRRVFGIRRHRTLGPAGIRMMHIDYQTKELARLFYAPPLKPKVLEVAWWPHDIGTISVKVAPDEWLPVTAADPMWIGKSFDDLMMIRHSMEGERDRSDAAKARAMVELDAASHRAKVLRGILPTTVTDKTYERYEADFMRFMSTAESDFEAPEYVDLFDGIIDLQTDDHEAVSPPLPKPNPLNSSQPATAWSPEDYSDLME